MKRIVLIFLLLTNIIMAQYQFCHTRSDSTYYLPSNAKTVSNNIPLVVRIFIHIMTDDAGNNGISYNNLIAGLNNLPNSFEPYNICFSIKGIDTIRSSYFLGKSNYYFLCDKNTYDCNGDGKFDKLPISSGYDVIDVYVYPEQSYINGGFASGIPGKALIIGGVWSSSNTPMFTTNVFPHEMGHCLVLYHTFHGPCEDTNACPEDPNGSNCSTCGDLVCDTPADNTKFNLYNSCNINPYVSPCYDTYLYSSPTNLIMDYIPPQCMEVFTPGQGERMRNFIINSFLQDVRVPDNLTLVNFTFNSGEDKLYDVVNKLEVYNLTVNSGASLTLRAGEEIIIGPNSHIKTGSNFRAYIDTVCSTIDEFNSARVYQNKPKTKPKLIESQQKIFIHPNPVSHLLYIETTSELAYEIYNVLGNKVKEGIATTGKNRINASDLSAGVYVIKLTNGKFSKVLKFVKIE